MGGPCWPATVSGGVTITMVLLLLGLMGAIMPAPSAVTGSSTTLPVPNSNHNLIIRPVVLRSRARRQFVPQNAETQPVEPTEPVENDRSRMQAKQGKSGSMLFTNDALTSKEQPMDLLPSLPVLSLAPPGAAGETVGRDNFVTRPALPNPKQQLAPVIRYPVAGQGLAVNARPYVVAGLGGSSTRVLARWLQEVHLYTRQGSVSETLDSEEHINKQLYEQIMRASLLWPNVSVSQLPPDLVRLSHEAFARWMDDNCRSERSPVTDADAGDTAFSASKIRAWYICCRSCILSSRTCALSTWRGHPCI